jgi:hypothetical protein
MNEPCQRSARVAQPTRPAVASRDQRQRAEAPSARSLAIATSQASVRAEAPRTTAPDEQRARRSISPYSRFARDERASQAIFRSTHLSSEQFALGAGVQPRALLGDGALLLQLADGPIQAGRVDPELVADLLDADPGALLHEADDVLATIGALTRRRLRSGFRSPR